MVVDIFQLVVGGGGWCWLVVARGGSWQLVVGGWWHSLV